MRWRNKLYTGTVWICGGGLVRLIWDNRLCSHLWEARVKTKAGEDVRTDKEGRGNLWPFVAVQIKTTTVLTSQKSITLVISIPERKCKKFSCFSLTFLRSLGNFWSKMLMQNMQITTAIKTPQKKKKEEKKPAYTHGPLQMRTSLQGTHGI